MELQSTACIKPWFKEQRYQSQSFIFEVSFITIFPVLYTIPIQNENICYFIDRSTFRGWNPRLHSRIHRNTEKYTGTWNSPEKCLQLWQSVTICNDLCYLFIEYVASLSHLRATAWHTLCQAAPPPQAPASSPSHTRSFNILIDNF